MFENSTRPISWFLRIDIYMMRGIESCKEFRLADEPPSLTLSSCLSLVCLQGELELQEGCKFQQPLVRGGAGDVRVSSW